MQNTLAALTLQDKLAQYRPSAETIRLVRATPIVLAVGISGAGKNAIVQRLLSKGGYHFIVSHTTRKPRVNDGVLEQDGREYHFITLDQAEAMLDSGQYVEAKQYGSNVYGTSAAEIRAAHNAGQVAITDLEVQGVAEYQKLKPDVTAIFVLPPDYETWQERLAKRYGSAMDPADFDQRMKAALRELTHALETPGFHFIINDNLEAAVREVEQVIHATEPPQEVAYARTLAQALRDRIQTVLSSAVEA